MSKRYQVKLPVDKVLDYCKGNFESVLVIGWTHDNKLAAFSSDAEDEVTALQLAARFLSDALSGDFDEESEPK